MRRYKSHHALQSTEEMEVPFLCQTKERPPLYGTFNTVKRKHRPEWCGGGVLMITARGRNARLVLIGWVQRPDIFFPA